MIIGSELNFFKDLTSTNVLAKEKLDKSDPQEGSVIYTDYQTSGKGQAGNRWESQAGKNLLFSTILYPESVEPQDQFLISMTISLGIHDFISRYSGNCKIKWPNDIYVVNDKIAGILIENEISGRIIKSTIAGIGININQEEFPQWISNPVSLKKITGVDSDRKLCLTQVLSDLDARYKQLLYGSRKDLKDEYISRLYRFSEWHPFRSSEKEFYGRIEGVSESGMIRIENSEGNFSEFSFKEINFLT
jgi:BirA family transcriptional regulator, biotin operon repressor / biotin---[acetyl-CoA-carboxylase] ligase